MCAQITRLALAANTVERAKSLECLDRVDCGHSGAQSLDLHARLNKEVKGPARQITPISRISPTGSALHVRLHLEASPISGTGLSDVATTPPVAA